MTPEQLEKMARQHADGLRVSSAVPVVLVPLLHSIAKDSYTQGVQDAFTSQWVSVDERLPDEDEEVLTYSIAPEYAEDENTVAYYNGEGWYATHGRHIHPNFWMPIPKLNTEKE